MRNTMTVLELTDGGLKVFLDTVAEMARADVYPRPTRLRFALEDETGEPGEKPMKYAEDGGTWSLPFVYPRVTEGPLYDPEIAGDQVAPVKALCGCQIVDGLLDTSRCAEHVARPF